MDYSNSEKLSVSLEPCLPLFVVYKDQEDDEVHNDDLESEHQDFDCVSHGSPQTTRQSSLVCSFCGLAQPSQHLLNEHHLDHIEEDCKYCPYCCFTCLAPRTLKKHLREHAAHNQMCHRHCNYIDMHDPNGDFYIDGEEESEGSCEEASDDLEVSKNVPLDLPEKEHVEQRRYKSRKKSMTDPALSTPKKLPPQSPQLPLDAAALQQMSELLKASMAANGMLRNGLNASNFLEKLLLAQLQSSMSTNGHKIDANLRDKTQVFDTSESPETAPSDIDYSKLLESTHDSIAEKIQSFFHPDDGSMDGDFIDDSEDGDMSYACPTCQFTCSHRSVLTRHLTTHSESFEVKGKVYLRCPQCPFCSSSKSNLHRHIATHSRKLGCPSSEVSSSGSMNWDVVTKRAKTKPEDPELPINTSPQQSLPTILNGKTLLFCTVCDYTSYYKSNLNRHMARHGESVSGEPSFNSSNSPDSSPTSPCPPSPDHEQSPPPVASEPVPKTMLSCKSCTYTAHNLSNFRKHSLIHTQSKNLWHCCMCTYSSFEKSNVKRHIRMKHRQSGEGVANLDIFCYMKKEKKFRNGKVRFSGDGNLSARPEHEEEEVVSGNGFLMDSACETEASKSTYWPCDEELLLARWREPDLEQQLSNGLANSPRIQRAVTGPLGRNEPDEDMEAAVENGSSFPSCRDVNSGHTFRHSNAKFERSESLQCNASDALKLKETDFEESEMESCDLSSGGKVHAQPGGAESRPTSRMSEDLDELAPGEPCTVSHCDNFTSGSGTSRRRNESSVSSEAEMKDLHGLQIKDLDDPGINDLCDPEIKDIRGTRSKDQNSPGLDILEGTRMGHPETSRMDCSSTSEMGYPDTSEMGYLNTSKCDPNSSEMGNPETTARENFDDPMSFSIGSKSNDVNVEENKLEGNSPLAHSTQRLGETTGEEREAPRAAGSLPSPAGGQASLVV